MSGYCFNHGGQRVEVDLRGQVIRAEIDERAGWMELPPEEHSEVDEDDSADSITALESGLTWPAPLFPSVAAAGVTSRFTPLFAMVAKAKAFDDRLYARIERLAHDGVGRHPGLYELLAQVRERLEPGSKMRGLLDAAAHLTGSELPESGPAKLRARKWLASFLKNSKTSKPIGFYAASEYLSKVFKHDRLLQEKLEQEDGAVLRSAIEAKPELYAAYQSHLRLVSRLTGSLAVASVLDASAEKVALLPASDSPERRLIDEMFGTTSIPDGFHLGTELISRIRDGRLRTEPTAEDGWYAHQFHAMAALLSPETEGLQVGGLYRSELKDTFKALFALTRETHVKQLEYPLAGGCSLTVAPRITVEPVAEYYGRVASAYGFLRAQLIEILGAAAMNSPLTDDGALGVADAVAEMESLFRGAEAVCRDELGCSDSSVTAGAARATFRSWQQRSADDPDLQADMRVAVPVYYDIERETVRVCVTLGVETRTLRFEFVKRPTVGVYGASKSGRSSSEPYFGELEQLILSPITVECDVRVPPSREELRALCDKHQAPSAIKRALEAS